MMNEMCREYRVRLIDFGCISYDDEIGCVDYLMLKCLNDGCIKYSLFNGCEGSNVGALNALFWNLVFLFYIYWHAPTDWAHAERNLQTKNTHIDKTLEDSQKYAVLQTSEICRDRYKYFPLMSIL